MSGRSLMVLRLSYKYMYQTMSFRWVCKWLTSNMSNFKLKYKARIGSCETNRTMNKKVFNTIYNTYNSKEVLWRPDGQQINHKICLKPLNMIFLAVNFHLVKKKSKYLIFFLNWTFSYIYLHVVYTKFYI